MDKRKNSQEKIERNKQIYLEKRGYRSLEDRTVVNTPVTYRKLMAKYDLCQTALLLIVKSFEE